ncbi:hypothetical protein FRC12_023968 [Ceratobasidium sp. 428]|nr:hypothetical protein FRC12_023968 [Ceratobasidium sp. 428]
MPTKVKKAVPGLSQPPYDRPGKDCGFPSDLPGRMRRSMLELAKPNLPTRPFWSMRTFAIVATLPQSGQFRMLLVPHHSFPQDVHQLV